MSQEDYRDIQVESTLPKSWEEEVTFNDILYDWMARAPWLAISAAAHIIIFLIMTIIPWSRIFEEADTEFSASIQPAPEPVFEDPPEEEPEEIEEEEPTEEPVLMDAEISDHNETDDDMDFESMEGDPDFLHDSPFNDKSFNEVIGIGGGDRQPRCACHPVVEDVVESDLLFPRLR